MYEFVSKFNVGLKNCCIRACWSQTFAASYNFFYSIQIENMWVGLTFLISLENVTNVLVITKM